MGRWIDVSIVDIFPTIFDIAGIKNTNPETDGQTLVPLINRQQISEKPAYMETHYTISLKSQDKIGLRTSEFKYFRDRNNAEKLIHLYNLKNDPFENNNIAIDNPDIIKTMEEQLQKILKNTASIPDDEFNEEETKIIEDELKRLGYV